MSSGHGSEWLVFGLVLGDAMLLAVLELFFLPLRFDGLLLPYLAGAPFPLVVVLAMVTTPLLVSQAAHCAQRLGRSRFLAAAPLGMWLLTMMVLAVGGPGGDQMFVADWRALALLVGGALPAAYVLGRMLAGVGTRVGPDVQDVGGAARTGTPTRAPRA